MMEIIKYLGKELMETAPSETVVGNVTRRILVTNHEKIYLLS